MLFEASSDIVELSERLQSMGNEVSETKITSNNLPEHLKSSVNLNYDLLILRVNYHPLKWVASCFILLTTASKSTSSSRSSYGVKFLLDFAYPKQTF